MFQTVISPIDLFYSYVYNMIHMRIKILLSKLPTKLDAKLYKKYISGYNGKKLCDICKAWKNISM